MPKPIRIIQVALFVIMLVTGVALVVRNQSRRAAAGPQVVTAPVGEPELTIPPFNLVDQDGRVFSNADLLGKLTVMDVFFTNCPLACPIMTEKMSALSDALVGLPVRYVSISIDPARDTPARLREYRTLHNINGVKGQYWTHLTSPDGSDIQARAIVEQGLKSMLEVDRTTPIKAHDGSDMHNILHPTWFFLLDGRDGTTLKVISLYQSSNDAEMQRLAADVRRMTK